jgi:hypothetical protein
MSCGPCAERAPKCHTQTAPRTRDAAVVYDCKGRIWGVRCGLPSFGSRFGSACVVQRGWP